VKGSDEIAIQLSTIERNDWLIRACAGDLEIATDWSDRIQKMIPTNFEKCPENGGETASSVTIEEKQDFWNWIQAGPLLSTGLTTTEGVGSVLP
jgi:hypothetical protein